MNLNTYRCGCGRIETLPHAKARPGPCTHGARPARGDECGPWRPAPHEAWPYAPGWIVEERYMLGSREGVHAHLRATKPRRRPVQIGYRANERGRALSALAGMARAQDAQRFKRVEAFWFALRGLCKSARLQEEARYEALGSNSDLRLAAASNSDLEGYLEGYVRQLQGEARYEAHLRLAVGSNSDLEGYVRQLTGLTRGPDETDTELRARAHLMLRASAPRAKP